MDKVTAYTCKFCPKLLISYSGMNKHEKRCFKNPESRSCLICKNLQNVLMIDGKLLNPEEVKILRHEVKGTYTLDWDTDPDSNGDEYPILNDEFKYLYDAVAETYCSAYDCQLKKLRTECERFRV